MTAGAEVSPRPGPDGLAITLAAYPQLLTEWDYEANEVDPAALRPRSSKVVGWVCGKGHQWTARVSNRTSKNTGCPYCTNHRLLAGFNDLATTAPELAAQWSPANRFAPTEVMAGSGKAVIWRCDRGHEWTTSPNLRRAGSDCPVCSLLGDSASLAAAHPGLLAEWDYEANDVAPADIAEHSDRQAHWVCAADHRWTARVRTRTRKNRAGCPICVGETHPPTVRAARYRSSARQGVDDLATTHPDLAAEYDSAANDRPLAEVGARMRMRAHWRCAGCGHRWTAPVRDRAQGKLPCRRCSTISRRVVRGVNDLVTTHPRVATEWDHSRNTWTPDQLSAGSHVAAHWICAAGHRWKVAVYNRRDGAGCPRCARGGGARDTGRLIDVARNRIDQGAAHAEQ